MTGQLRTMLHTRADDLEAWSVDLDTLVRTADRRVRHRRIGVASAGLAVVAAALTTATVVHSHDDSTAGDSGFATDTAPNAGPSQVPTGGPSTLVHTRYFDVPRPPEGFHVVGSLPSFAAITLDGTVDDLYRDTDTGLPQADVTQILRVFYNTAAADSLERGQDPGLGEAIHYDGRTFFHNTTWDPDVDYVQYRRADGTWLRLQYPKKDHFSTRAMVTYLDAVQVNPGAQPQGSGGPPQG